MSAFGDKPPDLDRPGFGTPRRPGAKPSHDEPHTEPGTSARGTEPGAETSRPGARDPGHHGADTRPISITVNGTQHTADTEPRTSLADFLRQQGLTGTKIGCERGTCGSCTVHLDGEPILSCLTLAVQADNAQVTTIEGLPPTTLQDAFHEHHALQCGFCTPGFLMTLDAFLKHNPDPTDDQLKDALKGNLCRCTGYAPILEAVRNR